MMMFQWAAARCVECNTIVDLCRLSSFVGEIVLFVLKRAMMLCIHYRRDDDCIIEVTKDGENSNPNRRDDEC